MEPPLSSSLMTTIFAPSPGYRLLASQAKFFLSFKSVIKENKIKVNKKKVAAQGKYLDFLPLPREIKPLETHLEVVQLAILNPIFTS